MGNHGRSTDPSTLADQAGKRSGHSGFRPRLSAHTGLRRRFILLASVFSVALILLVFLGYIGFQAMSGARAYVHGESQWAKAQKQAIIALAEYAATGNDSDFAAYQEALEVILGDRRARLALDRPDPDHATAREGFLAGRNHPEDVDLMIRIFIWGRHVPLFEQAVDIWAQGDHRIDELDRRAQTLHRILEQSGPGSQPVRNALDGIMDMDVELTELEDRFSATMSRLSHQIAAVFSLAILVTGILLLVGGNVLASRLLRSAVAAERNLRESEERYRALVDQPEVGMWHLDQHGRISYLNPAMRDMLGLARHAEVGGLLIEKFVAPEYRDQVRDSRKKRARGESTTSEVALVPRSGPRRQVLVHGAPIMLDDGRLRGHVGTCLDITDRKQLEQELRHQAFHDPLTGLPNRSLFMDRLNMAVHRARRDSATIAVLFVDLDGFKAVNDNIGHAQGDQILCEAADRLQQTIRARDTIARIGGDEFAVILENIAHQEEVRLTARRIIDVLAEDFHIAETRLDIGASIGIVLSKGEEDETSDLLKFADGAMYDAKHAGGNTWHIHDPERDALQSQAINLNSDS